MRIARDGGRFAAASSHLDYWPTGVTRYPPAGVNPAGLRQADPH
jgi:hypothetical protein